MGPKALMEAMDTLAATRRPLFLHGQPGIGKSSIVGQWASEKKLAFMDIRCLLHDPSDLKFPIVDAKNGTVRWVNSIFPRDPKWTGIVALEEIDKCGPMMQGALLQPTLDRKIGDHLIPEGVWFVLIGNRMEDQAGGHQLITPLRSRCIHLDLEVSNEDWNEWAVNAEIDFRVRTFLYKVRPNLLFKFDPSQRSSPNPRSWEFASDVRKSYRDRIGAKAKEADMKKLAMFDPIAGCVGEGAAAEFLSYCRIADNIPDVDTEILANPEKAMIPELPDLMWALCGAITERARTGDSKIVSAAWTYALRLPDEFSSMLGKDILKANQKTSAVPGASEWVRKHKNIIISSKN
jgi:hypothetical protein